MPTSSQEPRGPGLSSSLVTDFRAILSSLEQEKAVQPGASERPASAGGGSALPPRASADVAKPAAASTPRSYGEVRERIAALGEVGDLLNRRPSGAAATSARPASGAGGTAESQPRRRSFGAASRASGEADGRRKRNSSKDVITWQRLGVLAIFIAVVGGGAVMLQSLAAREEAKVADEVIGNAAVASVAPSAPAPVVAAAAPVQPTAVETAQLQQSAPTHSATASVAPTPAAVADSLPPLLRDTASPFDASTPVAVTAFAAPATAARSAVAPAAVEPAALDTPAATPAIAAVPAAKPVALPKEAPRPPARPVVASAEAAPARAAAVEAEAADEADTQAGFGGDPVGTATIRSSVTMRGAPRKGAAPIGNLSPGQKVDLVACHGWCEVIVDGKRGFIYKSFVNAGTSARVETEAEANAATQ